MPFIFDDECPECNQEHGIKISFDNLGDHECPKCQAKDAITIDWDTEYDLDPVEE